MGASLGTRPFAFCIMSPRVTATGEANRKGSRSESESEQGDPESAAVDPKPVRAILGQREAPVTGGGGANEWPLKRPSRS